MDGLNFYFNGRWANDLGVSLVNTNTGLKTQAFLGNKEIVSETIPNNPVPYVYGVTYSPLEFTLYLSCLDNVWNSTKRRQVASWLDTDNFEEFYSEDDTNRRYYFMYKDGIDLSYDGELKGYIEVHMINISPYSYKPLNTVIWDSSLLTTQIYTFINDGDVSIKPELSIYKVGAGDVSILNQSNKNIEFNFTGLADKETVYVDCANTYIQSDIPLTLRYDNFNQNYLELVVGTNTLVVTGKCKITVTYQLVLKG